MITPAQSAASALPVHGSTVLTKTVLMLRVLGTENRPLGLADICRRTHLAKSTAHRLLASLVSHHLVRRVGSGYVLDGFTEDGASVRLRHAVMPHMVDLYESSRAMVCLAVLRGPEIRYIERVYGSASPRTPSRSTDSAPAYCTAGGKLLLAFHDDGLGEFFGQGGTLEPRTATTITTTDRLRAELDRIRRQGLAVNQEEYAPGISCLAAPVIGRFGSPVAALVLGSETGRLDLPFAERLLRRCAFAASRTIRTVQAAGADERGEPSGTVLPRTAPIGGGDLDALVLQRHQALSSGFG